MVFGALKTTNVSRILALRPSWKLWNANRVNKSCLGGYGDNLGGSENDDGLEDRVLGCLLEVLGRGEARQVMIWDTSRSFQTSCMGPNSSSQRPQNTLHGADLKLSKTSECPQQASKHPTGAPRDVTEHCNQRTQRTPMIADHH